MRLALLAKIIFNNSLLPFVLWVGALSGITQKRFAKIGDNAITAHIRRIRDKFREVDSTFDSIRTEYGMGYRWLAG